MKIFKPILGLKLLISTSIFMLVSVSMPALCELIQPTRTIEKSEKQTGYLSVFSEPTKMDVYLDRIKIGVTPIFSHVDSSGRHLLQVGETEKEIYILSGELQQFSNYKGQLIHIPVKTKQYHKSKPEAKPLVEKEKSEIKEDISFPPPNYFPFNPKGPIY